MAINKGNFVHLHTHSHYSLLDGLSKIPDLVAQAKEQGMTAIALTDHGNMHGAIEFYKECKKADIKPIIGVEAYIANRSRHDKEPGIDNKRYHLTLLARNTEGYRDLMKAVSISHLEGFYYKPRMDKELLKQYGKNLICLSGCPGSEFVSLLREGKGDQARELIQYYFECFGRENVFIELMSHDEVQWYTPLRKEIIAIAKELDRPVVGTWDSHYLKTDDREAHDTLLAINTNNANFKLDGDYSFIDGERAMREFDDCPEAISNTAKIADMVDIEIDLDNWQFPDFPLDTDASYMEELRRLTYEGVKKKKLELTQENKDRIEYELEVIEMKGYPSYFLCVADMINKALSIGIYSNTRGSAAGSLVSYLLGITNINPMDYGLIFERFLNPERPSLPDIDMDFADDRRDEIIDYTREKYGKHAVAQIGTFGKMLARGVVRDVARALEYPYATGDRLAKMIPLGSQGFPMTIERALEMNADFSQAYKTESDTKRIVDLGKRIEGCVRHVSVHAAGVVISPTGHIDDFSPVQFDPKGGKIITQYDMYTGGREGVVTLPKFDFLGLRNLTILADAVDRVKKIRGIEIDIENLPKDDKKTYDMLSRGESHGVFQFASDGMRKWLRELKPSNLDDLIAMVALYRPGPMAFIPDYIERKRNPSRVTYLDPRLEPILQRTYGIIIYQEDILIIAVQLAGYSWLEADKFRKAVGKKIPEEMAKQHDKFTNGCIENGMKPDVAKKLWDMIETFAAYGFNKAHAGSYAQLAYRTAYMKAHYPPEYMSAIMTAESGDIDKVAEVMEEAKRMGFTVMAPDVNESFSDFTVVVDGDGNVTSNIRFGMRNIKNFGEEIGKGIIYERKNRGPFKSMEDFLERVQHKNLNKKSLEALILTGAMDQFGERGNLLANIETMLKFNRELGTVISGQSSLFGGMDDAPRARLLLDDAPEATQDEKLVWERELLGMYVSGHPLDKYRERIQETGMNIKKVVTEVREGITLVTAGLVDDIREIYTKKEDKMAFIKLEDFTGVLELVAFPRIYAEFNELLQKDQCIAIKGRTSDRNGERSMIIEKVKAL